MSTGSILVLSKGHTTPPELAKKLLENFKSSVSVAAIDPQQGLRGKFVAGTGKDGLDLQSFLNDSDTKFKDKALILRLEDEESIQDEERQPFELVQDKDGKTVLLGFTEGEFSKYATDEATVGPETAFIQEYFADRCIKAFKDSGQDLQKFYTLLESKTFRAEMEEHMQPRGCVVLMGREGNPLRFEVGNDKGVLGKWGFVTDSCGYKEEVATTTTSVPVAGKTKEELSNMSYKDRKAYEKAQKETKVDPPAVAEPPKEDKVPPKYEGTPGGQENNGVIIKGEYVYPPIKLVESRQLHKFYEKHSAKYTKDMDVSKRPEIHKDNIKRTSYLWAHFNQDKIQAARANKDTTVHNQPDIVDKVYVPIIPAKDVEAAMNIATDDKMILMSNEDFDKEFEKHGSFTSRTGISFEDVQRWTEDKYSELSHKALCRLVNEMRLRMLRPDLFKDEVVVSKVEEPDLSTMTYKERKAYEASKKAA